MILAVKKLITERYLETPRCRKERIRTVLKDIPISIREVLPKAAEEERIRYEGSFFRKLPLKEWNEYILGYFKEDLFEKYLSDYASDAVMDKNHPYTHLSLSKSDNYEELKETMQRDMENYLCCNGFIYKREEKANGNKDDKRNAV